MSDKEPAQGDPGGGPGPGPDSGPGGGPGPDSGDEPGERPDLADDAREAAMIRKVLRLQERHREGGVDPELEVDDDGDLGPRARG